MADTAKKLHLKNVRLSFPSIFSRAVFDGKQGKFEATLLLDKSDKKTKKALDDAIEAAIATANIKVPADKRCLKDGDDSEYDGYEGVWSIKASNGKRPTIIGRDKAPLTEDDDVMYAGCYVNAIIDIWIQNNQYGKRANANLYGVQFVKDGDAFGSGPVDVTDEFDDIEDDDEL
jgi:hypothetical protein